MPDLPATSGKPGTWLYGLLLSIALATIAVPTLIVLYAPPIPHHPHVRLLPQRVVPKAELPPVEPVTFQNLDPDDARAFNATVPFVTGPNPAARPFKFAGSDEQRARAVDCLAAAVLYEAGDDPAGQRAVAQVVLNRARHPAFPKTVCGVVFQGSERVTGCQFTFTCDGALMTHRWSDAAWVRARTTAIAALAGSVYPPVGYATHYHTDWVVPYWQSSLDKIAAVHTHLFFRWTGWWGTPPAFNRHVSPDEPAIAQLALYSDAHRAAAGAFPGEGPATADITALAGDAPAALANESNSFLITFDPHMPPDAFPLLAVKTCGERIYCKVLGWTSKDKTPAALPLQPSQIATMSFSYLRDRSNGYDKALWNCGEFRRANLNQCMKLQVFVPVRQTDNFRLENVPATAPIAPAPTMATPKPGASGPPPARKAEVPASGAKVLQLSP